MFIQLRKRVAEVASCLYPVAPLQPVLQPNLEHLTALGLQRVRLPVKHDAPRQFPVSVIFYSFGNLCALTQPAT